MITVKVELVDPRHAPAGKRADVEVHFTAGPLAGLKLIGFAVWERRVGAPDSGINITFPSRTYSAGNDRRSFAMLRPVRDVHAQDALRDVIVTAFTTALAEQKTESVSQTS